MTDVDRLRAALRARTDGRWLMTAAGAGEPACLDRIATGLTRAALDDPDHWSASPSVIEACVEAVAAADRDRLLAIVATWRAPATLARGDDGDSDLAAYAWWFALPFLRGTPWFPPAEVIEATPWLRDRARALAAAAPAPAPTGRLAAHLDAVDPTPEAIAAALVPLIGAPDVDAWQLGRVAYPLLARPVSR